MARPPDAERRAELLDAVVAYLAEHGLAGATLRPIASALDLTVQGLVHHFGSKDDLVVAALDRAAEQQALVQERWLRRHPGLSQADLLRRWWRWINASSENLHVVRLGLEAATLDATHGGLPPAVRADQIVLWRSNIEKQLIADGVPPDVAVLEASLAKAMFTGLVIDLLATGQRKRLGRALELALARLEQLVLASAERSEGDVPTRATPLA